MEFELALAAIQKCLDLLHDDLDPDIKLLWLFNQSLSNENPYPYSIFYLANTQMLSIIEFYSLNWNQIFSAKPCKEAVDSCEFPAERKIR